MPEGLGSVLKAMDDLETKSSPLPEVWVRTLLTTGSLGDLMSLPASTRSAMGPKVEAVLRASAVVNTFDQQGDEKSGIFMEGATYTGDKGAMKEATMAFLDLKSGAAKDLPKAEDVLKTLRGNLIGTIKDCREQLDQSKSAVQVFYSQASRVQEAMKAGADFEGLIRDVTKDPKACGACVEGKGLLSGHGQGPNVYALLDIILNFQCPFKAGFILCVFFSFVLRRFAEVGRT